MRTHSLTVSVLAASTLLLTLVVGAGDPQDKPAAKPAATHPGFEKLKTLAGEWVDAAEPAGEKDAKGAPPTVIYKVTAAGSAVAETLFPGTPHEMITMYYMDGDDLVLTHYCAMGNQPRMKAEKTMDGGKLVFKFAGGSNIDPAKDGHMHDLTITFVDADHVRSEWTSYADGKKSGTKTFDLKRRKP